MGVPHESSPAQDVAVEGEIAVGHAVDAEALRHPRAAGGAVEAADPADRLHRLIHRVDKEPVTPSSISSGMEPRLKAITGVPQAMASTTDRAERLVEADQVQEAERAAQRPGARLPADGAG